MPLSTDLIENMDPYRMKLPAHDGLKEDSDILVNQIRSLSKTRIKEKIAKITSVEYDTLIQHLCKNF